VVCCFFPHPSGFAREKRGILLFYPHLIIFRKQDGQISALAEGKRAHQILDKTCPSSLTLPSFLTWTTITDPLINTFQPKRTLLSV
jgi:hypothetical protein